MSVDDLRLRVTSFVHRLISAACNCEQITVSSVVDSEIRTTSLITHVAFLRFFELTESLSLL